MIFRHLKRPWDDDLELLVITVGNVKIIGVALVIDELEKPLRGRFRIGHQEGCDDVRVGLGRAGRELTARAQSLDQIRSDQIRSAWLGLGEVGAYEMLLKLIGEGDLAAIIGTDWLMG